MASSNSQTDSAETAAKLVPNHSLRQAARGATGKEPRPDGGDGRLGDRDGGLGGSVARRPPQPLQLTFFSPRRILIEGQVLISQVTRPRHIYNSGGFVGPRWKRGELE